MQRQLMLATLAMAFASLESVTAHAQSQLLNRPARLESPIRALKMPPTYGIDRAADEILATFVVDSSGAIRHQTAQIDNRRSSGLMVQYVREYLRDLHFIPARSKGRSTADSVQIRFSIPIETPDDQPLSRSYGFHCDGGVHPVCSTTYDKSSAGFENGGSGEEGGAVFARRAFSLKARIS